MYGHFNTPLYDNNNSSGYLSQSYPSHFSPLVSQCYIAGDFDSMAQFRNGNGSSNSGTSSSYMGSPNSPLSCCTSHPPNSTNNMIQRSLSSHSLYKNGLYPHVSSPPGVHDLDISPVRRVSSTGDLDKGVNTLRHQQHQERSPLANESASIILEGMTRASPYNPEEKKERIERYRSKRSQRNFHKKIQYACRKTLADSRPRIRGRFARNDEIEKTNYSSDLQWNQMAGEEDEEDDEQWIHLIDSFAPSLVP